MDLSVPYSRRLSKLRDLLQCHHRNVYYGLKRELGVASGMIYTNIKWVSSCPGLLSQFSLPFLALASIVVFAKSGRKDDYEENDVKVTLVLLCCTTLLEFLPCFQLFFLDSFLSLQLQTVAQHNHVILRSH